MASIKAQMLAIPMPPTSRSSPLYDLAESHLAGTGMPSITLDPSLSLLLTVIDLNIKDLIPTSIQEVLLHLATAPQSVALASLHKHLTILCSKYAPNTPLPFNTLNTTATLTTAATLHTYCSTFLLVRSLRDYSTDTDPRKHYERSVAAKVMERELRRGEPKTGAPGSVTPGSVFCNMRWLYTLSFAGVTTKRLQEWQGVGLFDHVLLGDEMAAVVGGAHERGQLATLPSVLQERGGQNDVIVTYLCSVASCLECPEGASNNSALVHMCGSSMMGKVACLVTQLNMMNSDIIDFDVTVEYGTLATLARYSQSTLAKVCGLLGTLLNQLGLFDKTLEVMRTGGVTATSTDASSLVEVDALLETNNVMVAVSRGRSAAAKDDWACFERVVEWFMEKGRGGEVVQCYWEEWERVVEVFSKIAEEAEDPTHLSVQGLRDVVLARMCLGGDVESVRGRLEEMGWLEEGSFSHQVRRRRARTEPHTHTSGPGLIHRCQQRGSVF